MKSVREDERQNDRQIDRLTDCQIDRYTYTLTEPEKENMKSE